MQKKFGKMDIPHIEASDRLGLSKEKLVTRAPFPRKPDPLLYVWTLGWVGYGLLKQIWSQGGSWWEQDLPGLSRGSWNNGLEDSLLIVFLWFLKPFYCILAHTDSKLMNLWYLGGFMQKERQGWKPEALVYTGENCVPWIFNKQTGLFPWRNKVWKHSDRNSKKGWKNKHLAFPPWSGSWEMGDFIKTGIIYPKKRSFFH